MTTDSDDLNFMWNIHSHLQESIRFADSKAGIILVANASLIGCLYGDGALDKLLKFQFNGNVIPHIVGWIAVLSLCTGWLYAATAVYPRLHIGTSHRLIYWKDILLYRDVNSFLLDVESHPVRQSALAEQILAVASIADLKFERLRPSMIASLIGFFVCGIALSLL